MKTLEEKFKNMHLLSREERKIVASEIKRTRPDFAREFYPQWWYYRRCEAKVLIVCDGNLNYHTGSFGLSEFLTTFTELEATTGVDYKVTLAHRQTVSASPLPVVVSTISSFNFDTSVNLEDFDQIWLFGINSGASLSSPELTAIHNYMDNGGGLFATGDHGSLGSALCGQIQRVSDMRLWTNTSASNDTNEVSMTGKRRNDTNQPHHGDTHSEYFDNQSDNIPQTIAVRTFDSGLPHPLLSISKSLRSSGIIDIMPDHPHEGECAPETSFTVNGVNVHTQIIATSFVLGGSVSGGKAGTDPHCFPSIAVWDGRQANVGRIVVDSTWHHFVNINLNGVGSGIDNGPQSGLDTSDFEIIRQYFMNIATWMTRQKFVLCWRRWVLVELLLDSQLIEASLNDPLEKLKDIPLADLNSIGALAEEILSTKFSPSFARQFLVDLYKEVNPELANELDGWIPQGEKEEKEEKSYYQRWINLENILHTSIGTGFISLRDKGYNVLEEISEKNVETIMDPFFDGMQSGEKIAVSNFQSEVKKFQYFFKRK